MTSHSSESLPRILDLAWLARIRLSEAELQEIEKDFPAIIQFVATLRGADTAGVASFAKDGRASAPLRPDDPDFSRPGATADELLRAAPKTRDRHLEVPSVFDRS